MAAPFVLEKTVKGAIICRKWNLNFAEKGASMTDMGK